MPERDADAGTGRGPLDRLRALLEAERRLGQTCRDGYMGDPFPPGVDLGDLRKELFPQLLAELKAAREVAQLLNPACTDPRVPDLLFAIEDTDAAINAHLPAEPSGSDVPDTVAAAGPGASNRQQGAEPEASDG